MIGPNAVRQLESLVTVASLPSRYSMCNCKINFGWPKEPDKLGITSTDAGDVIHSVTKQHSKNVLAGMKLLRHVEGVVQHCLPVIAPAGIKYRVGDVAPVQVKFVLSQAGDEDDRAFTGPMTRNSLRKMGSGCTDSVQWPWFSRVCG